MRKIKKKSKSPARRAREAAAKAKIHQAAIDDFGKKLCNNFRSKAYYADAGRSKPFLRQAAKDPIIDQTHPRDANDLVEYFCKKAEAEIDSAPEREVTMNDIKGAVEEALTRA